MAHKFKPVTAYACVGSHGGIFSTLLTTHEPTIGRFQIYETRELARKNACSDDEVVEVRIIRKRQGPSGQ